MFGIDQYYHCYAPQYEQVTLVTLVVFPTERIIVVGGVPCNVPVLWGVMREGDW